MSFESRLDQVADRYRSKGYRVVVRPGPKDLPDFAKDFRVELVATRDDGSVLVSVKKTQSELETDREIPRYVEVTEKQPHWRFDLVVLGSENEPMAGAKETKEPSEEDTRQALGDVERMLQAGFGRQALIAAWAVVETAMRRTLQAAGQESRRGMSPRTLMNELYSGGMLQSSDFR